MDNRDIKRTAIMYTNYQGNLLSDQPSDMTAYPILVGFFEDRSLIVIPTPPGQLQDTNNEEDSENVD